MPYVKADPDRRKKGDKVKSELVKFRVSKADFDAIHRLAEKSGLSISELIRSALEAFDNENKTR